MTTQRGIVALCRYLLSACLIAALWSAVCVQAAPIVNATAQMRPYSGIGVLMLEVPMASSDETFEPLRLYDDPAISRKGELNLADVPRHEWIFGPSSTAAPLIVMARKTSWMKVAY